MNSFLKKITISAIATLSISSTVNAELISVHLNSIGDNLVTVDTSTGLEWLDVSLTKRKRYHDYRNGGYGFRVPTFEEINQFFTNNITSIQNPYVHGVVNADGPSDDLALMATLLSSNQTEINYSAVAKGLYMHERGEVELFNVGPNYSYGLETNYGYTPTSYHHTQGIMLVSDGGVSISSINDPSINIANSSSVPLTSSIALFSLAGLPFLRRRIK
jgi:hypothetical protein